jgi:hypothetical protein
MLGPVGELKRVAALADIYESDTAVWLVGSLDAFLSIAVTA